jgi:hypothetical protein
MSATSAVQPVKGWLPLPSPAHWRTRGARMSDPAECLHFAKQHWPGRSTQRGGVPRGCHSQLALRPQPQQAPLHLWYRRTAPTSSQYARTAAQYCPPGRAAARRAAAPPRPGVALQPMRSGAAPAAGLAGRLGPPTAASAALRMAGAVEHAASIHPARPSLHVPNPPYPPPPPGS